MKKAKAVFVEKFAECGPGKWWYVLHPEEFLIECGTQERAEKVAAEINAGREAMLAATGADHD